MNPEPQQHFMRFLIQELKQTTHQLFAHIVVAHLAQEAGFPFNATLQSALASPEIQRRVEERVAGLEELVGEMDDSTHDRLIQEYLAKQNPSGSTN
jgi:hypothetical protein